MELPLTLVFKCGVSAFICSVVLLISCVREIWISCVEDIFRLSCLSICCMLTYQATNLGRYMFFFLFKFITNLHKFLLWL